MEISRKPQQHIKALDGLRALAVIFVLLRHSFQPFSTQFPEMFHVFGYNVLTPLTNGWIGVDLFFVLSGFLITLTFIRHRRAGKPLKTYMMKRALRIIPAYYVVLILCTLLVMFSGDGEKLGVRFVYHLLFLQDYTGADINSVFWSLGVEEKFYILSVVFLPFLLFVFARYRLRGLFLVLVSIIVIGVCARYASYIFADMPDDYTVYFFAVRAPFHSCFEPLILGVGLGILYQNEEMRVYMKGSEVARYVFRVAFLSLLVLVSWTELSLHITLFDVLVQPLIIALIFVGLVYGVICGGAFKWLEHPVLRHIAVLSYSLYLVHLPLREGSFQFVQALMPAEASVFSTLSVFFSFYMVASFAFAYMLYFAVERPCLRWKNRL